MNVHFTGPGSEHIALDLDGPSGTVCAKTAVSVVMEANRALHGLVLPPARGRSADGAARGRRSLPWRLLAAGSEELVTLATASEQGQPRERALRHLGQLFKRAGDVTIALFSLLILSPLVLVIALTMKVSDPGPVFFAHTRIGRNGRPFRCWKLRTMVVDADERLRELLASDERAAEQWRTERKLSDDPRITGLGRLLRKSSIDELPQLVNVLRGEMSCVGPRPVTAEELERYGDTAGDYLRVRPGITGLWQVCGRSQRYYVERVALDRLYVRNWSLGLDLAILVRTIPTLLRFDRAA